ncbi:MAG TPA: helix-turn-helix transcriptional regulator [Bacillus sp. (in: firmicutes)]|nr:helix-turn-helix transcriptional regulator [Bacillus sp. (in: firmicutes)]
MKNIFLDLSLRQQYRVLRKQKGIKLKHIAKEVKVSVAMLSMYENEIVNLSKEKEEKYRRIILH